MEAAGLAFSVAQTLLAALSYPPLQQMFTKWDHQSELDSLTSTVSTVSAVLLDAQSVGEEKLSNVERDLIEKLKEAVYEADDLLDEFATLAKRERQLCMEANEKSLKKVPFLFSRFKGLKVRSMSRKVKDIRQRLDQIVDDAKFGVIKVDRQPIRKREETYAYVNKNKIVGREVDQERIVNMLLDPNIQRDAPILAIVGMGGLGKTALAQLVYNDERIQKEFPLRYWVCISDQDQRQFSIKAILTKICKVATGESNIGDPEMDSLVQRLRDQFNQNKYLLVLDDVWTEDRIECNELLDILLGSRPVAKRGSRIVVTTRSKSTATVMGCNDPYELQGLSDEDSWLLFKITSGMEHEKCHDLVKMGEDIVKKCATVPLAIKVVGSFLNGQNEGTWRCFQQHGLSVTAKDENKIMSILKFSYNHLSPSLKSCFIYCAMLPKDSVLSKEIVTSLWIAHDYVKDEGQGIDVAAEYYFNILVQRCFFQDLHEDEDEDKDDEGTVTFKIHDLIHDMAHQVAGKEIFIASSTTSNLGENIRHLCDVAPGRRTKDFMTKSKIRSYIKYNEETLDNISFPLSTLLKNWKSLRVLALSNLSKSYLPNAIGELLHLRWLCLHGNEELKKLPKSLTKLINLQTLCLQRCSKLEELPGDFSKLINLRTLYVTYDGDDGLSCMPLGMEKMACLTRLNKFVLGQRKSSMKREVRLEDLRVPRNLRGSLKIYISANYKHSKENGGGGGYLCNTQYLESISIEFSNGDDDDDDGGDVLEDLQPHSDLKELTIVNHQGSTIPSWAREDELATSLPNLVKIVLVDCDGLKELPWLGKLQHLKILHIWSLKNLEYMENRTRGTSIGSSSGEAASSSMALEIFFPSLENLKLINLPKLKGWWRGSSWSGMRDDVITSDQRLALFPRLSKVGIEDCPKLRFIPLGPAMETLFFVNSGIMKEYEDQKVVGHMTCISSNDFGNSGSDDPKIKEIKTTNVRFLNFLPMVAFQGLSICGDGKLESLSEVEEVLQDCTSSLRFLKVLECKNLRSVSRGLQHLAVLESLKLANLPELMFDEMQGEEEDEDEDEDDVMDNGMPWRCHAQCLRSLELWCLPKVVELPKGMRYLTVLQSLEIVDLPLKGLPGWVGCLQSLHSLEIIHCKNLESLPEALQKLTSLKRLKLENCTKILYERCTEPNGEYWPIIQHINEIIF